VHKATAMQKESSKRCITVAVVIFMVEEMKLNVAVVVFGYRLVKIEPRK
jgi:hypothetical protein